MNHDELCESLKGLTKTQTSIDLKDQLCPHSKKT